MIEMEKREYVCYLYSDEEDLGFEQRRLENVILGYVEVMKPNDTITIEKLTWEELKLRFPYVYEELPSEIEIKNIGEIINIRVDYVDNGFEGTLVFLPSH